MVNPENYMLYTPLLPEAAAGTIEPRHVAVPLRTMCPHADLVLGSAVAHDPERRIVHVESEAGRLAIAYADLPAVPFGFSGSAVSGDSVLLGLETEFAFLGGLTVSVGGAIAFEPRHGPRREGMVSLKILK